MRRLFRSLLMLLGALYLILVMAAARGMFGASAPVPQNRGALVPFVPLQFFNASGVQAANGRLCSLAAGTTTSWQATYQDAALTTPNSNPQVLSVTGHASTPIYIDALNYKFILYGPYAGVGTNTCNGTPVGSVIWTLDNVYDFAQLGLFTSINKRVYCVNGANFGAMYTAAVALLPSTGGIVDCSNLQGAQTVSSDVFTGVTKPITLIWPTGTVSSSASLAFPITTALDFPEGGMLSMGAATTATINGGFKTQWGPDSAPRQVFTGSGNIVFDANYSGALHRSCYPEWWGTNDGSNTDNLAANKASTACNRVIVSRNLNFSAEWSIPYVSVAGDPGKHIECINGATILAAANTVNLVHWSDSFGSIEGCQFQANGHTGTTSLRVTPTNETAAIVTSINYNRFSNLKFNNGDESIVIACGPAVGGVAANCYYNTFENIFFTNVKRGVWLKDQGFMAPASGANSNYFSNLVFNGSINTGIQIDAGGGGIWIANRFENITSGTSPNNPPTGIIIAGAMANGGTNNDNVFIAPHWENCTRDFNLNVGAEQNHFILHDALQSLTNGTPKTSIVTTAAQFQQIWGGILSTAQSAKIRIDDNANVMVGATAAGGSAVNVVVLSNGTAPTTSPSNAVQVYSENGELKMRAGNSLVYTLGGVNNNYAFPSAGALFVDLGAPNNGTMKYCSNCNGAADGGYVAGSVCAAAPGTGALAFRIAGTWRCY